MESKALLLFLAAYWLISVGVAAWFGQMKGRLLEGVALGVLMGPFGTVLAALLPAAEKRAAVPAAPAAEPHPVEHIEHHAAGHEEHHEPHAGEAEGIPVAEHAEAHGEGETTAGAREMEAVRKPVARRFAFGKDRPGWDLSQIDWGWVFFYGSWALFVAVSWLWLLLFS